MIDMIDKVLEAKGVTLPEAPQKGGLYAPTKSFGGKPLMYVSGCGCNIGSETGFGKLGKEYTTEEGQKWARNCMLNVLAVSGIWVPLTVSAVLRRSPYLWPARTNFMNSPKWPMALPRSFSKYLAMRLVCPLALPLA